jgi:very-short-patch-repair endonuclease
VRGTTAENIHRAQEMRRHVTEAEACLWAALRRKQLKGLRFRAQHPVGPFILDFYCAARKLVVEVDGPSHDSRSEQDAIRTAHLEAYGYRVLRFSNAEVLNDLESVLARITESTP